MWQIFLQKDPLNEELLMKKLGTESDGAIVVFIGRARNISYNKKVLFLEYDVYESMARSELEKICNIVKDRWNVTHIVIAHRFGIVRIGEASVFVGISAPHRAEAFESAAFIINTIKQTVPIWKREYYEDGSAWISGNYLNAKKTDI